MSRPKIEKCLCEEPKFHEFNACEKKTAETVSMTYEEYETIYLIDYEHLQQEDCARRMGASRTTIQFIYTSARAKLADFIVNGKKLEIDGGNYIICNHKNNGCMHGKCVKCECNKNGQD